MKALTRFLVVAVLGTAAGVALAAPNGVPVRIQIIGDWREHDPSKPRRGYEPWTASDVAGFLELYPTGYVRAGIRDALPPGNLHWLRKGAEVDELQATLAGLSGTGNADARSRICVSHRPDAMSKMVFWEGTCDPARGGGGCDWEGDMDGSFGEPEGVVKHAGFATGGAETRLEDRTGGWTSSMWHHRLLVLRPGSASEERRRIVRSRATTLEVDAAWTQPPRPGDRYEIRGSFDPRWVKRVPRSVYDAALRELWLDNRNVCGNPPSLRPCRPAAEPLDPFAASNRRTWPAWLDRGALTALATPETVPVLYGLVLDPTSNGPARPRAWTDPFFSASSVVMDVTDPAYRDWRIRYLMYKLQDYGIDPGEPACLTIGYKPGYYTYYDETLRGPSGDPCAVPGSHAWTGPAHVCRDLSAPGGPMVAGLYGPGEYERAINSYLRELIAKLAEHGWNDLRIIVSERPSFTPALWEILDPDVRHHPKLIGETMSPVDPPLAALRARPRPSAPSPPVPQTPAEPEPPAAPDPVPSAPEQAEEPEPGETAQQPVFPREATTSSPPSASRRTSLGSVTRSSGGGRGGRVEAPGSSR